MERRNFISGGIAGILVAVFGGLKGNGKTKELTTDDIIELSKGLPEPYKYNSVNLDIICIPDAELKKSLDRWTRRNELPVGIDVEFDENYQVGFTKLNKDGAIVDCTKNSKTGDYLLTVRIRAKTDVLMGMPMNGRP